MKIEVRLHGLDHSDALRDHVVRRVNLQLGRFGPVIGEVVVRLGDVNGPKGGVDKRCRVSVRGRHFAALSLDEASPDAYAAADVAVERVAHAVGRALEKTRASRRAGAQPWGLS